MPICLVTWLGKAPEDPSQDLLFNMLGDYIDEDDAQVEIIANHWRTSLQEEKVIICGNSVFFGLVKNEILALVPDVALNIPRLIWMCDAERVTIEKLTLANVRRALSL